MADEVAGGANLWSFLATLAGAVITTFGVVWVGGGGRRKNSEDAGRIALQNITNQSAAQRIRELERDLAAERADSATWEARARRADSGWHGCYHRLQGMRFAALRSVVGEAGAEPPEPPLLETPL